MFRVIQIVSVSKMSLYNIFNIIIIAFNSKSPYIFEKSKFTIDKVNNTSYDYSASFTLTFRVRYSQTPAKDPIEQQLDPDLPHFEPLRAQHPCLRRKPPVLTKVVVNFQHLTSRSASQLSCKQPTAQHNISPHLQPPPSTSTTQPQEHCHNPYKTRRVANIKRFGTNITHFR